MDRVSGRTDAIAGIVLLVLAGLYFAAARGLPTGQDELGPAFFPSLLSLALAVLASVLLWRGRTAPRLARSAAAADSKRTAAVMAATLLYVALFTTLGFLTSTWLYTLAVTLALRRWVTWPLVIGPTLTTLLIYVLLVVGLGARLPAGTLFTIP